METFEKNIIKWKHMKKKEKNGNIKKQPKMET